MDITPENINQLLDSDEDEHLEFKEAKNQLNFDDLLINCAALANEGGGKLILGITDKRPRQVVGTNAVKDKQKCTLGLNEALHLKFEIYELYYTGKRIIIIEVPSHLPGTPVNLKGTYYMRQGESVVPMSLDQVKHIINEQVLDFSALPCTGASLADLDVKAIDSFRRMWARKSGNNQILSSTDEQILNNAELLIGDVPTVSAVILMGGKNSVGRLIANSELIFEYRSGESSGQAQQRIDYRAGYFLFYDELWDRINLRNDIQHFHEGLFVRDIRTFNEIAVREAIQNAISHRDYNLPGSIFIRQFPRRIEVISPGSFPEGITPENVLYKHVPRNRRIAETLARCGMVERSGQGMNLMFESCIKESKPLPNFSGTDDYQVYITISGDIRNPRFVSFLEKIGQETLATFSTDDYLLLDIIEQESEIPTFLRPRIDKLIELGVIERIGRGRGTRFILSRRYYQVVGKKGIYTRKRGLDRDTNKELLRKHISDNGKNGSPLGELKQVLPSLKDGQIRTLLRELQSAGDIFCQGRTRAGKWFPTEGKD